MRLEVREGSRLALVVADARRCGCVRHEGDCRRGLEARQRAFAKVSIEPSASLRLASSLPMERLFSKMPMAGT